MTEVKKLNAAAIMQTFQMNVTSLRVYAKNIGAHADEIDQMAIKRLEARLLAVCPELSSILRAEKQEANATSSDEGPDDSMADGKASLAAALKQRFADPKSVVAFARAVKDIGKDPPINGVLLRRGVLISLVSLVEWMEGDLLRWQLELHPDVLGQEQTLTLKELKLAGSMEEAVRLLIGRKVDDLMRGSLRTRIKYLRSDLGIDLQPIEMHMDEVQELFERRNVVVHNKGIVNSQYMDGVAKAVADSLGAKIGSPVRIDDEYLCKVLDLAEAFGIKLIQQFWRKLDKPSRPSADTDLNQAMYEALRDRRFSFVVMLEPYAIRVEPVDDVNRRMMIVNSCIARLELGHTKEMEGLIASVDWSAAATKFRLALAVLRDDRPGIDELLLKALDGGELGLNDIEEWPLFRRLRDSPDFEDARRQLRKRPGQTGQRSTSLGVQPEPERTCGSDAPIA